MDVTARVYFSIFLSAHNSLSFLVSLVYRNLLLDPSFYLCCVDLSIAVPMGQCLYLFRFGPLSLNYGVFRKA